ncbi:MAG: hypothetical protein VZQ62_05225, partial [Methanosphaera sp.]|nr:hypothetical protein [Methanosphaera sp.]
YGNYKVQITPTSQGNKTITAAYYGTNVYNVSKVTSTFLANKRNTTLTVGSAENVYVGNNMSIYGKLTSNNKNLANQSITIKVDGKTYTTNTTQYGNYKIQITPTTSGTKIITSEYTGTNIYFNSLTNSIFQVNKMNTTITLGSTKSVIVGNDVCIYGKLSANNKNLSYEPVIINVNGQKYNVTTTKYGNYKIYATTSTKGIKNINVTYDGNSYYNKSSATTTFTVQAKDTKIIIDDIDDTPFTDYAYVTGYLKDLNENTLSNANIIIQINEIESFVTTDINGHFRLNYQANKIGKNNLLISFSGNSVYKYSSAKKTFNVIPKNTFMHIEALNSYYTGYSTIAGFIDPDHYVDTYDANYEDLRYATVSLYINGVKYSTKTDETGDFNYKFYGSKTGIYNVTAVYAGSSRFKGCQKSYTFYVYPKNTRIELNDLFYYEGNYGYKEVYGTCCDFEGNPLTYTTLTVDINGKKYSTKTDDYGGFYYTFSSNENDDVIVTVSYPGSNQYVGSSASTSSYTFDTELFIEPIGEYNVIGDTITIKGYLKDKIREYQLINLPITVNVNGETFTTSIDEEKEIYEISFKANKIGINNVTVSFAGDSRFTKSVNKTTFVVEGKVSTITIISPVRSNDGEYIKINGSVYDNDNNMLKNTPLTLLIDGKKYYTKTDSNGIYSYNYRNSSLDYHSINVIFEGNSIYRYSETGLVFIPQLKEAGEFEILTPQHFDDENINWEDLVSTKKIGTDIIYAWYQEYEGQGPAGANVCIFDIDMISSNKITNVTFYYRNDINGNIITKNGKNFIENHFNADVIPGYTPYKAIVKYRIRNYQEMIIDNSDYDNYG